VRHHEQPWQHRTTVVLDVRRDGHDPESFERAVSAAASVVVSCHERGELVRLVTTAGHDTGFVDDDLIVDHVLNELAAVEPSSTGSLAGALRQVSVHLIGGRLVSCIGDLADTDVAALAAASTGAVPQLVVACRRRIDLASRSWSYPSARATH